MEEELRYERKTVLSRVDYCETRNFIKLHPLSFRELYPARSINSIYYDNSSRTHYRENVEGVSERSKFRIRWYGNPEDPRSAPLFLEVKKKFGMVGSKDRYPLKGLAKNEPEPFRAISKLVGEPEVPEKVVDYFHTLQPNIYCGYQREYYLSADKKFRLTLDVGLVYKSLRSDGSVSLVKKSSDLVIEVKYAHEDERFAEVFDSWPFRLGKKLEIRQCR